MPSKAERRQRLLELWRERPENRRRANDVLSYYSSILENEPDLLFGESDYQFLFTVLRGHISDE